MIVMLINHVNVNVMSLKCQIRKSRNLREEAFLMMGWG